MKIQQINNFKCNLNTKPLSFKSSNRVYADCNVDTYMGGQIHNYTYPFRKDIPNWFEYMDYILDNFSDKDKINIYDLACSDGSEAYTMYLALKKSNKLHNKQIFPIIATDKNEGIIELAKSGRINLGNDDYDRIKRFFGEDQKYFTDPDKKIIISEEHNGSSYDWKPAVYKSYKVSDEMRQAVNFGVADILETIKSIKDGTSSSTSIRQGNTFVSCRNVMPYLTDEYKSKVITSLRDCLKTGSLLALGNFDNHGVGYGFIDFAQLLQLNGFEKTKMPNLYRRI